jgi:NADP-dependent aldehyde dehydrogenase
VFGASNFPLAFSVAGGDTASALAAGNPVIVKAHSAHPGTSELIGDAVVRAVRECGLPEGTFSLLYDAGYQIGAALVKRPEIKAVAFTGSRNGGRALMEAAATRREPIPFYAEMSSVNPLFFLAGGARENWDARALGLFASVTTDSGQFCTKPGLVFVEESCAEMLMARLTEQMSNCGAFTMLAPNILQAYKNGISERQKQQGVLAQPLPLTTSPGAALFRTTAECYLQNAKLGEEIFGPAILIVTYSNQDELLEIAEGLEGQLTATVHGEPEDLEQARDLIAVLESKVGRLIFNGFPTGVEVNHSMVHGGPWPATSDSRSTSVGGRAILRFSRPICYQGFPQESLPDELKDANPLGILRMVDGVLTRESAVRLPLPREGEPC